jgi:hypothetical protein
MAVPTNTPARERSAFARSQPASLTARPAATSANVLNRSSMRSLAGENRSSCASCDVAANGAASRAAIGLVRRLMPERPAHALS